METEVAKPNREPQAARLRKDWELNKGKRLAEKAAGKPRSSVRELRLQLGMSGNEFAAAIGLSKSGHHRISQLENGMRAPEHLIARMVELAEKHKIAWWYVP